MTGVDAHQSASPWRVAVVLTARFGRGFSPDNLGSRRRCLGGSVSPLVGSRTGAYALFTESRINRFAAIAHHQE